MILSSRLSYSIIAEKRAFEEITLIPKKQISVLISDTIL